MEMLGGVDLRIACDEAVFGVLEPARGLFAGGGTTARLPRQVSFPHAMELLLTADKVSARRAYEMGLVNEVVPREDLMEAAMRWARRVTKNAPLAIQATKESVMRGLAAADLAEAYRIEQKLSSRVFETQDAKEGPKAFAEKRAPNWQAR
jgi:enoyl-CoA hydratase